MNNQDAQRMRSETKVNYKPVSFGKPYQCGDSWRQDVVVEVTTIGRNGKSRTETFEVTVPVEKIDGAIRWSVLEVFREIRSTVEGALLSDAMAARKSLETLGPNRDNRRRHGIYAQLQKLIRDEGRKLQAGELWDQFPHSREEAEPIEATNGREYRVYLRDDNDTEFIVQEDAKTGAVQKITFSTFARYFTRARAEQKS